MGVDACCISMAVRKQLTYSCNISMDGSSTSILRINYSQTKRRGWRSLKAQEMISFLFGCFIVVPFLYFRTTVVPNEKA